MRCSDESGSYWWREVRGGSQTHAVMLDRIGRQLGAFKGIDFDPQGFTRPVAGYRNAQYMVIGHKMKYRGWRGALGPPSYKRGLTCQEQSYAASGEPWWIVEMGCCCCIAEVCLTLVLLLLLLLLLSSPTSASRLEEEKRDEESEACKRGRRRGEKREREGRLEKVS